jgi:ABC-2 type transport system ATP-binding protein
MPEPAVYVESLSKTYTSGVLSRESVHALRDVTLTVQTGEIFGLLGPNGAGKTTLLKILLSIVRPTQGRATLFGQPVHDASARTQIGFLPEKHRFPDFMTADQMLRLYGRLSGVPPEASDERIPALLERVGMTKWRSTKIKKYSKGMLQRVGLAQALLNDPDIVFLDEPTDGVDPVGRRDIRDLLLWIHDQGKTVFLNSHLLSEVEKVCTRVAILNEGRLVRQGSVQELTAVERVYDLKATPVPEALLDEFGDMLQRSEGGPTGAGGLAQYRVLAEDRSALNAVLDRLRQHEVEVEAVQPVRRTLEDYFIDVVSAENSANASS